ncbi:apolipoprotein N-acyltransferase [Rhodobacteraceae bacterium NNCM2]|nr:apolipoprotein N-acyltransferase [Coraliihabitans acroporae]
MTSAAPSRSGGEAISDRPGRIRTWQRLLLALLVGGVMTMGHAPVDFPWGFFIAIPAAVWLVDSAPSARGAALMGWAIGFGYFVTGLHWIGHAFLVDPDRHAWMLPFALTLLPGFLALFWAGAFWAARKLWHPSALVQALALATCWTLVELLRGHILTGFPWALPAYAWVGTPILQSASWAGPYGLTFVTLFLCALPLGGAMRRRWAVAVAGMLAFAGLWLWGAERVPGEVFYEADAPVIRVVQPNAPQNQKWDPAYRGMFYDRLLTLTAAPTEPGSPPPDVVIWPETAVPFLPAETPNRRIDIATAAGGVPVVMGALHADRFGDDYDLYNSLTTIMPDATLGPRYDKHHLVPFGEYLPFSWILAPLGLEQIATGGGFAEGVGPQSVAVPGLPPFAAAICYEMIFPYQIVAGGPRPGWIVTITNDAWFGGFAGPQQHRDQAKFRAVEQGLPVVRAANTGISAVIDPYGRQTGHLSLHQSGFLDRPLPAALPVTIYGATGDLPTVLMLLGLAIALVWLRYSRFRFDKVSPGV